MSGSSKVSDRFRQGSGASRSRQAFRASEGVGNRRAHVSRTQLRDDRAVLELDRRVYDALGVDHDLDAPGLEVKSQRASITSRPLFMRLAESTLILRPMDTSDERRPAQA